MKKNNKLIYISTVILLITAASCLSPKPVARKENKTVPTSYNDSSDSTNAAQLNWRSFFKDELLKELIDTALKNNQELNITIQEINIARNEVRAKKGEYLPYVNFMGGASIDKSARYTRNGALESNVPIRPGEAFPDPLNDYTFGAYANWELDIWKKLRNAKKAAAYRYLASIEGRNFMTTKLVAEVADAYFELMALDNHLKILQQNVEIQQRALSIVRLEKIAARVTELAVHRFEAEVLKNQSRIFDIQQQIKVTENHLNFLVGGFPKEIKRNSDNYNGLLPQEVQVGLPSQLLQNRPDVSQAELELMASKLDVKVAKAHFYPSLGLRAGLGYQAFDPKFLISPESMLYSAAGDLMAPLINRNAIKAAYNTANSKQLQAVYNYEQTILRAYLEVSNQMSNINNLQSSYDLRALQVDALTQSIDISTGLFKSARADYMEVLLTQRDALDAKIELVETKKEQLHAVVRMYQALGGGWN